VKVRKECVDKFLSFTSEKLRRDTVVFHTSRSARISQNHARCGQASLKS
jgi:hypothetical protein